MQEIRKKDHLSICEFIAMMVLRGRAYRDQIGKPLPDVSARLAELVGVVPLDEMETRVSMLNPELAAIYPTRFSEWVHILWQKGFHIGFSSQKQKLLASDNPVLIDKKKGLLCGQIIFPLDQQSVIRFYGVCRGIETEELSKFSPERLAEICKIAVEKDFAGNRATLEQESLPVELTELAPSWVERLNGGMCENAIDEVYGADPIALKRTLDRSGWKSEAQGQHL
jgi:hypothetical protein